MSSKKKKTQDDVLIHQCYDCLKASQATCPVYEDITEIIEENFDNIKIRFQVTDCEYFVPD